MLEKKIFFEYFFHKKKIFEGLIKTKRSIFVKKQVQAFPSHIKGF